MNTSKRIPKNGKFWKFLDCRNLWLKCQIWIMENWKIARFFSMMTMQVLRLFYPVVYTPLSESLPELVKFQENG